MAYYRLLLGVVGFVVFGMSHPLAFGRFVNHENDPDLALAMRYDAETNGGDRAIANRELAEQHYLAYLEKTTDPDRRAHIYVQLGVLYCTNFDVQNGEEADFAKGTAYMREAIRIAPDRVGVSMIRARLNLCTPLQNAEERVQQRLESYRWLSALDAPTVEANWLPTAPGEPPSPHEIRSVLDTIDHVKSATVTNILGDARRTADPTPILQSIATEFAGTELGTAAVQLLGISAPPLARTPVVPEHTAGTGMAGPPPLPSATDGNPISRVVFLTGGAAAALFVAVALVVYGRRRAEPR